MGEQRWQGTGRAAMALGLCLLALPLALPAQESAELDALEPGVDTSAMDEMPADAAGEVDDIDPAVTSDELVEDVVRSESGGTVMDRMELGRTEITGNQELPKVLYIVPWQKADAGELDGRPINTLLNEVLAPVDREEFARTVDYYGELYDVVEE